MTCTIILYIKEVSQACVSLVTGHGENTSFLLMCRELYREKERRAVNAPYYLYLNILASLRLPAALVIATIVLSRGNLSRDNVNSSVYCGVTTC